MLQGHHGEDYYMSLCRQSSHLIGYFGVSGLQLAGDSLLLYPAVNYKHPIRIRW